MNAHISVNAGAVETYIYTKCDTRPRRIPCLTVEASLSISQNKRTRAEFATKGFHKRALIWETDLICFLGLQHFENLLGLLFSWIAHRGVGREKSWLVTVTLITQNWSQRSSARSVQHDSIHPRAGSFNSKSFFWWLSHIL